MTVVRLSGCTDLTPLLEAMDVDRGGVAIMARKGEIVPLLVRGLCAAAANILKQDALAVGADAATPRGVVVGERKRFDVLVLATPRQLARLAKKERAQPFGLADIGRQMAAFLDEKHFALRLMGVLNINDDSFFAGSRADAATLLARIDAMIAAGADVIDIGAVSSRPGSRYPGVEEELARLRPVADLLYREKVYERVTLSIDAFEPAVVAYAVERGFGMVNDITGLSHDETIRIAAANGVQAVMMHMEGTPRTMQADPVYEDVILAVDAFFEQRLARASDLGLSDVVLDVGIGFGKTLAHNLSLIRHLRHFARFGRPILVGASRKSMIDAIVPSTVEERLPGTLAIHLEAVRNGASIIRVHDVAEHRQALAVWQALAHHRHR